jgi:hypothetical protein
MILSSASGIGTPVTPTETPNTDQTNPVKEISKKEVENLMSTEEYVRNYFSDIPIMVKIAQCESTFRHLDRDGNIHRGRVNRSDVGVMQINEYYHLEEAENANYDIYTLEGNTAYARKLYEKKGTQPWISSKPCWGKYENGANLALNLGTKVSVDAKK